MWIRSITDYDVIIDSFASVLFHVVLRGNDVHTKRNSMTTNNDEYDSLIARDLVKENVLGSVTYYTLLRSQTYKIPY